MVTQRWMIYGGVLGIVVLVLGGVIKHRWAPEQKAEVEYAAPEWGCISAIWLEGALAHKGELDSDTFYGMWKWAMNNRAKGCCYDSAGFHPCRSALHPPVLPAPPQARGEAQVQEDK